ncbi:periplasmic protein involved in polysaccharide export [Aequorivita sublithincola DSM 14238]|uniref:Periplasmic protein involved in polysaccharide export n=1 Tax=Aequorivita sublithincola (strain DSM 14238 / LMG 21431 / ACAM 643 / 9-3) TaxID=746697 RepID=I3YZC8_AEQSU|nr:polysaccharide biosynthesis/export family protein [Aequorivita sublithincola]AFL82346.1 periplasmic protein involved in polysaccharide export [Aequorivita sublithincola DSM 14238]
MKGFVAKVLLLLMIMVLGASCVSRKRIVYFRDLEERKALVDSVQNTFKIQPDDLLSIEVSAYDLNAVRPFNLGGGSRLPTDGPSGATTSTQQGYLTAQDGTINMPVLGTIKVAGLTRAELSDLLVKRISEYVISPIVTIRIMNFRVSVLGEVGNPGTFNVQGERLTLPEALGLAGDMTLFGRRDNLLVIRDNGTTKDYKYLDIRESSFLNSDYYYLQQNDVVYVEPNYAQIQGSSFNRNTTLYFSIISLLISVLVIAFK